MSVIGEAASIAGIIGLAGQAIQAASAVYNLLEAYRRVSSRVLEIQEEIASLQQILEGVATLGTQSSESATAQLTDLHTSVLKCQSVLEQLKMRLQPLKITSTGFKRFFKKAKLAADTEYFSTISHQIHLCRADVSLHLELLQSATSLTICQQMNTVTFKLDNIGGCQTDASQVLLASQEDIRTYIAEQRLALSSLTSKVDQLFGVSPRTLSITPRDFDWMETRLKSLESRLVKLEPESSSKTPARQDLKAEQVPMHLIKPGMLIYEENGKMMTELQAVEDRKAMRLNVEARVNLIRHVQGLRLLLWLMRPNNFRASVSANFGVITQSCLVRQAKVTSLWEFCYSYTELDKIF